MFDDHLEDRPDPDADVGRDNVHQTKTGKTLELLDVQLKKSIYSDYSNGMRYIFFISTIIKNYSL